MTIKNRGWQWIVGVGLLALVALVAVRWALASPARRAEQSATATSIAGETAVAIAVGGTLTADASGVIATTSPTDPPSATPVATPDGDDGADDGDDDGDVDSDADGGTNAGSSTVAVPPASATTAPVDTAQPEPTEDTPVGASAWLGRSVEGGSIGDIWRLVDTRLGRHDGFTRIVWEWQADAGAPQWIVTERGGGAPFPQTQPPGALAGDTWLEVVFSDVIAMEAPQAVAPKPSPGGPIVSGVAMLVPPPADQGDDRMSFVVGLTGPARFTAMTLDAPSRLVLDVYDTP